MKNNNEIKKIMDEIDSRIKLCNICNNINDLDKCNPDNCFNSLSFKKALDRYRELKGLPREGI